MTGCNNFRPSWAEVSGKIIPNLGIIYEAKVFPTTCREVEASLCRKLQQSLRENVSQVGTHSSWLGLEIPDNLSGIS